MRFDQTRHPSLLGLTLSLVLCALGGTASAAQSTTTTTEDLASVLVDLDVAAHGAGPGEWAEPEDPSEAPSHPTITIKTDDSTSPSATVAVATEEGSWTT